MGKDNYDFYQEALKAFDAPIPQPKQEEPAREAVAEVTESAPQEKPKRRFSPWWAVALCAAVCLALVIGFGRGDRAEVRGENYVYGIILEYGEGYVTLATGKKNWYVELEGLEPPAAAPGALLTDRPTQPLWAFYDGQPEETDQKGCTKKITATFWKTDAELYTSRDEMELDLDGDGRKEIWSLRYTRELPTIFASSFVHRVRLTAKDTQGNILHAVYFDSPETMSAVFHNAGGKLSLVLYQYGSYEELDIRLEAGKLTVCRAGEPLPLYESVERPEGDPLLTSPATVPTLSTSPTTVIPPSTSPTAPPQNTYTVQFILNNPALGGATQKSDPTLLTYQVANNLIGRLDALQWDSMEDVPFETMGSFILTVDHKPLSYSFSHDGILMHGGKKARINTELWETLLKLMNQKKPDGDQLLAYLGNGDVAQMGFHEDGTASIRVSDPRGDMKYLYTGRYASFGKYYLLALGEDLRQIAVLRHGISSMQYIASMSRQDMFQAGDSLSFHIQSQAGSISLALRGADGAYSERGKSSILTFYELYYLRQFMEQRTWNPLWNVEEEEVLCRFYVFDGAGGDVTNADAYYLLTGCRLYHVGTKLVTTFDEEGYWEFLVKYLIRQSEPVSGQYAGASQDGRMLELELLEHGGYSIACTKPSGAGIIGLNGSYVHIGSCVVLLGWEDGPSYVHLDIKDGNLVYDAARSVPNEVFGLTTQITLMNLYVTNYQKAFLYLDLDGQTYNVGATLDENMAREVSVIMRTVQWNKLDGEPEGVPVGRFTFRDTYDPYKSATLYSGMRLVSDGKVAQLTSSQWDTVCQLMINSRAMNYRLKVELQGQTYRLNFSGDPHFFTLSGPGREGENAPVGGYYTVFGADICVCYGWDGEVFILRMEDGGLRLLPGYNGLDAFDIPDDTVFTP